MHRPNLILTVFCATESGVSVVLPPHLSLCLSLFDTKRKENMCNKIFLVIKSLFNYKMISALQDGIQMIGMKNLKGNDAPKLLLAVGVA